MQLIKPLLLTSCCAVLISAISAPPANAFAQQSSPNQSAMVSNICPANEAREIAEAREVAAARERFETSQRLNGLADDDTIAALMSLKSVYFNQGRHVDLRRTIRLLNDAQEVQRRENLETSQRTNGPEHPATVQALLELATTYQSQGRYGESEELRRRAMEILERTQGADSLAQHYWTLGAMYQVQGRYAEAERLLLRNVEYMERTRGSAAASAARHSVALLYREQDRIAEAEQMYLGMLDDAERAQDNYTKLVAIYALADFYQDLGHYSEAEPLFRQALVMTNTESQLVREVYAPSFLNALGFMSEIDDRIDEAEAYYVRALDITDCAYGPGYPHTLTTMNNLASLLIIKGRYAEAEQLSRRSLADAEERLGADATDTLAAANNLAVALQEQGSLAEAEALFRRVLEARQSNEVSEPEDIQAAEVNLATVRGLSRESGGAEAAAVDEADQPAGSGPLAANGTTCVIVTDVVIISGEEKRIPKRMCRTPPAARWSLA